MNRSFLRYAIVGLLGAAVHISILTILVEWAHWDPIVSSVAGFLVVLMLSYWLNVKWSFEHSEQSHHKAIFRYTLVNPVQDENLSFLISSQSRHVIAKALVVKHGLDRPEEKLQVSC